MKYTIRDIARKLNVSEETVRRWVRNGNLIAKDLGGKIGYRISEDNFNDFLTKRTQSSAIINSSSSNGLFSPFGIIGSVLGTVNGVTENIIQSLNSSKSDDGDVNHKIKLELKKCEIEKAINTLESQLKNLKLELDMVNKLLENEKNTI